MENENEITQIITGAEAEEILETEEIQEIENGGHLNVIPFQFIKLARNVQPELIDVEAGSTHQITVPCKSTAFDSVRAKYSKYYKQTYRPAWENMPDFKGWLKGIKGQPTRAYCTYCQKSLHAHRLSLLKHTCTIRHQKAAQLQGNPTRKMNDFSMTMENSDIQTVIVNDEGMLTEQENSNELIHSTIVYATQDEIEEEQDIDNEIKQNDLEDCDEPVANKIQSNKFERLGGEFPPISTHVTDTSRGAPVFGLSVSLYKLVEGRWTYINEGLTDTKGRVSDFFKRGTFAPGRYKLHYDVDRYFESRKQESVFPFIETVFDASLSSRYHFPLLLDANSYTTYRSTYEELEY